MAGSAGGPHLVASQAVWPLGYFIRLRGHVQHRLRRQLGSVQSHGGPRDGCALLQMALSAIACLAVLSWVPMRGLAEPALGVSSATGLSWFRLPAVRPDGVLAIARSVICGPPGMGAGC